MIALALLAALQGTIDHVNPPLTRVPVTVMLVDALVPANASAIILRRGAGRDVIVLTHHTSSADFAAAVAKYRELFDVRGHALRDEPPLAVGSRTPAVRSDLTVTSGFMAYLRGRPASTVSSIGRGPIARVWIPVNARTPM